MAVEIGLVERSDGATRQGDLARAPECVGIAALQSNPQAFRRMARRAAELLTDQPSPQDQPLAVTRQKAGGI